MIGLPVLFGSDLHIFAEGHELMKRHDLALLRDIVKALQLEALLAEPAVKGVNDP